MICPGCSREGTIKEQWMPTVQLIRDEEIKCDVKKWTCSECGAAFMSPTQATEAVKQAVAICQKKHGLLTADQIREGRRKKGLSVGDLAVVAKLGVATIKRLEAGTTIQRLSTNTLLLTVLAEENDDLPDYHTSIESELISGDDSAVPSQWKDEASWNTPDPWGNQQVAIDSMLSAIDSKDLALAA